MVKKIIKQYIVRKWIKATSIQEALKKEPKTPVDDIWFDDKYVHVPESETGFINKKSGEKK